jgi:hypothetical protein
MAKKAAHNPVVRYASITIDETDYKLAFSFGALAKAEKQTGCNLLSGMVSASNILDSGFPGASVVLGMFWASLSVALPDITIDEASALITADNVAEVWTAVQEAQALSSKTYKPEEKKIEEVKAAANQ